MKKTFLVIGLDRFGITVSEELVNLGFDVICLDIKKEAVDRVSQFATDAVIGDSTNAQVLREIGANHVDHAIVSIPGNVENSILTTMILSEMEVPKITVKVENEYHAKVASRVGATDIIDSEQSAGRRLARKLISDNVLDYYNITNEYGIYELRVSPSYQTKKLIDLDSRNKYNVNILLIIRDGKTLNPRADSEIFANDTIIVIAEHKYIHKFENTLK